MRDELLAIHGTGDCHICGKPKAGEGSIYCSYPHGMVPDKAVDADHPDGFWTWKHRRTHPVHDEESTIPRPLTQSEIATLRQDAISTSIRMKAILRQKDASSAR